LNDRYEREKWEGCVRFAVFGKKISAKSEISGRFVWQSHKKVVTLHAEI
jgi:hypothetical protein